MEWQYNRLYKSFFGIGAALVCFMLLFPILRSVPAGAQLTTADSREAERDARIRTFFEFLQAGSISTAFDRFLEHSPLSSADTVDLRRDVSELNRFGDILGWERYDTRPVGTSVVVVRYILQYDQYPVIWSFAFYRKPPPRTAITTSNPWVLVELQFDTNLL